VKVSHWVRSFQEEGGSVVEAQGEIDVEIREIASDSQKVSPGSLFIALKGSKQDGRQFISEAIERGAAAVVLEGAMPRIGSEKGGSVGMVRVSDARRALSHLASYFFGHPAAGMRLVGVTGTNGKTTTTFLIHALLKQSGLKAGLLGTILYDLGGRTMEATHTTPGSIDLQRYFSEMRSAGATHAVMEVSSHALDQGRVDGCRFGAAVFTNLTRDHLDYHGTLETYFASKRKLFDLTEGRRLINIDDPWGRKLQEEAPERSWSYGIERKGDLCPREIESGFDGIRMTVETPIGEIEIGSSLVGRYNIYNLLSAVGVGIALGLSGSEISAGIASMSGVPGRFEKIDLGQDFSVIVDYAHTEDALDRLLQAVCDLSPRRIITVFGCGGDRDRGKRPKMGAVSARLSGKTILTSDNPRSEEPTSILREIEAGFPSPAPDYEVIPNRQEAIARAIGLAEGGDAVVIAGKGHENYQIIGKERLPFDDRTVARSALAARLAR
jgi:UDP-N-acetylmuramoyl-L-alanyl-D-glutamate--2,6-diaminopimelate ligase